VSGHSYEGWAPSPVRLLQGALAAATVDTLVKALTERGIGHSGLSVEIASKAAATTREQSQDNAAQGRVAKRRAARRVVLPFASTKLTFKELKAILATDLLTRAILGGSLVRSDSISVVESG